MRSRVLTDGMAQDLQVLLADLGSTRHTLATRGQLDDELIESFDRMEEATSNLVQLLVVMRAEARGT